MNKMRLEVGQVVHAVHFTSTNEDFNELFFMPYKYNMNQITQVDILELTVTEHHKVLGDYDDADAEPKYDGFVLQDKQGRVWHNQYPRASYGQLSDEGDRVYHLATKQPNHSKFESYPDLMEAVGISYFETKHLGSVMREISRGIVELDKAIGKEEIIHPGMYLKTSKLIEVYRQTLEVFEEQYPGKTIHIVPSEKYPDIIQYGRVVDKEEADHSFFDISHWVALDYLGKLKEAYLAKLKAGGCYEQSAINLKYPNKLKVCFNSDQLVLVYSHSVWEGDNLRDVVDNTNVHTADTIDAFIAEIQAVSIK